MPQSQEYTDSLSDIRVLELTGELGPYAGKLYAGLGADVIHIEPISGDPIRDVGPFYKNEPGKERSLQYLYYNVGKRGMVLDLRKEEGKEVFVELVKNSDVLLESFVPGYLESLGLTYEILSAHNPKLVQTSITPFGQFGPYSNMPGSDLVCSALGGFLDLAGTGKDKPVRACDNQSYRMAEAYAGVASMIALFYAKKTGVGQSIDVCSIESVGMALENSAQYYDLEGTIRRGRGKEAATGTTHPCKDGYITIAAIMGKNKRMWEPFVQWMKEEGVEEWQEFDDDKWIDPAYRSSEKAYDIFCRIFERYTLKHDKMYLYEKGQSYRVAITPVSNGKDLLENPQLRDRNFWQTLRHDKLDGEVTFPGAPYEFNNLRWRLGNPAPHYGQHTREILTELGYSNEKIDTLSKEEVVYVE